VRGEAPIIPRPISKVHGPYFFSDTLVTLYVLSCAAYLHSCIGDRAYSAVTVIAERQDDVGVPQRTSARDGKLIPRRRCLSAFFDRQTAINFSLFRHASRL
jgi:hypothetical protein